MEPPSTPPDRKKRRVAPETPPKDRRFSQIVVFHKSHNLDFSGRAAPHRSWISIGKSWKRKGWQLRLPRKVTMYVHQILRLPQAFTLHLPHVLHLPRKIYSTFLCHEKYVLLGIYSLLASNLSSSLIYFLVASSLFWHLFSLGIYSFSLGICSLRIYSLSIYSFSIYSLLASILSRHLLASILPASSLSMFKTS